MTGTIRIGHDDQLLRCHVPHEPVQYIAANPCGAQLQLGEVAYEGDEGEDGDGDECGAGQMPVDV